MNRVRTRSLWLSQNDQFLYGSAGPICNGDFIALTGLFVGYLGKRERVANQFGHGPVG